LPTGYMKVHQMDVPNPLHAVRLVTAELATYHFASWIGFEAYGDGVAYR
jgi:hypothetical protein